MKFKLDKLRQWLDPIDAFFCIELIANDTRPIHVCEIGAYEGGFTITLLDNIPSLQIIAIDPYPKLNNIKAIFLEHLLSRNLVERVQLLPDYLSISNHRFALVHIDGEHSEAAVLRDINFARDNLAPSGIIVVDDIWHPLFPGIISAIMKTVHTSDLVPFLITRNKMYLCRETEQQVKSARVSEIIQKLGIPHSKSTKAGDLIGSIESTYGQDNSIKGYPQIVVESKNRYEQLIWLGLATPPRKATRIIGAWLPPAILSFFMRVFRR